MLGAVSGGLSCSRGSWFPAIPGCPQGQPFGRGDPGLLLSHPRVAVPSLSPCPSHLPQLLGPLNSSLCSSDALSLLQKMTPLTACLSSSLPAAAKQHLGRDEGLEREEMGWDPHGNTSRGRVSGWGRVNGPSPTQRAVKGREMGARISFLFWGREEALLVSRAGLRALP